MDNNHHLCYHLSYNEEIGEGHVFLTDELTQSIRTLQTDEAAIVFLDQRIEI